jgi:hypothetical protein
MQKDDSISSAGTNDGSSKNVEKYYVSQPCGKPNVGSSTINSSTELHPQDTLQWYLDRMSEYESQGWTEQTLDATKFGLVHFAIRTKRHSSLIDSLKNLFQYDKLLQAQSQLPTG